MSGIQQLIEHVAHVRPPHKADNTQSAFDGRRKHSQRASRFEPPHRFTGRGAGNDGHVGRQHPSREQGVDDFGVIVGGDNKSRGPINARFEKCDIRRGTIGNAEGSVIRSRPADLLNSPAPRAQSDGACAHEAS